MSIKIVLHCGQLLIFVLVIIEIECNHDNRRFQFNGKINFLNSSVPIPNTLSDELASKITNLVGYYENQLSQLNRELVGCQQFDYQTNCSTVGARLKDLKENFRKDLIKLREQALSLNELKTVRPKIFTNGIFFDRVFNIFNDYTLHLEFAVSVGRPSGNSTDSSNTTDIPSSTNIPSTTEPGEVDIIRLLF